MNSLCSISVAWFAFVAVMVTGARGIAQSTTDESSRAIARRLGTEGIDAFRVNDFTRADQKLEEAFRLYPTPTLGLWSGHARVQVGHWVEAIERFREATRIPESVGENAAQRQAQRDAELEIQALTLRIPELTIRVEAPRPEEVLVIVDGATLDKQFVGVARPLNPGAHHVTVMRGSEVREVDVLLVERDKKTQVFRFKAADPAEALAAAPSAEPQVALTDSPTEAKTPATASTSNVLIPIAIGALIVGGGGLVVSGATALAANGKLDDCPNHTCESQDAKDSYDSLKAVSTATFYIGGALALGGVITWLLAAGDAKQAPEHVRLDLGPAALQVRGAF